MKLKKFEINSTSTKIFLSASRINIFLSCPVLYFLKYHTDIGSIDIVWPGTLFGQTLHKILELVITQLNNKINKNDIIKQIPRNFTTIFTQLKQEAEDRNVWRKSKAYTEKNFYTTGEKYALLLTKYLINFFSNEQILLSEQKFVYPWLNDENVIITGITDVIIKNNDDYEIFDLKVTQTSQSYYFVYWDKMIQNLLYEYLTYQEYKTYTSRFSYIVLDYNQKMLFLKQKKIQKPQNIFNYFSSLNNIIIQIKEYIATPNFSKKNYSDNCKFCAYKLYCQTL